MHMNRKKYTIGTVSFEAVFPDIYEDKNPYSLFLDNDAKADVMYHYQYVENLPQKQGMLVDKQDFQETYKAQEGVYRYLYQKGKHLPYACTCFEKAGETVNVYLTKEAPQIWGGLVFQTIALEHLLARHHHIVLHASFIEVKGTAILFTAPCETGKSTQAELWRKHRGAEIINGDRVCISCNDKPMAHGVPMSGTSGICKNKSIPLRVIVYLEQGKVNQLEKLKGIRALKAIYSGCWINIWDSIDVNCALTTIENVISRIPVYRLRCVPDVTAIEILEKEIMK